VIQKMKCQQVNIFRKILFCLVLLFLCLMIASATYAETYNFVTKRGSYGSGNGQFLLPCGIAVDSSGNVYVADDFNQRIQKFNSNGRYLTQWDSSRSGNGQIYDPTDIAVDSSGNVYVVESGYSRIQKFAPNFVDFPSIIVLVAAILVLTVIFRRKKW
jgi:DNA-binding beta-propeller fold protein YncE